MNSFPRYAMTRLLLFLLTVAVGLLLAPASSAQPALDLSRLDSYFGDEPRVEVNLSGAMLGLAAAATAEDEPGTSSLIERLNAVTVRVYDLSSALTDLTSNLSSLGTELEADGWQTFVRVRGRDGDEGDNEDVWIYVREAGDAFGGLVVMALDKDDNEAAFVVIDGLINPEDISRLSQFGLGD